MIPTNSNENDVISWEDVKEIVETGRLELLHRNKSDQLKYCEFKAKMTQKYGTIDNYLYQVVLKWPKDSPLNDSGSSQEYFSSKTSSTHYNLRLNDFPYTIDSSISHYVLWSKLPFRDPNDYNTKNDIDLFLKENFPGEKEWLFFINPPQIQSIKTIWHGHIFVRDIPKI
ncbi:hypothetical protein C1645_878949 [Glomus cerebriforme]|uniref:Uncharacterized protein n=1 Tax=Glomus cerebriforme TaxID=658196 RepID=A0A397SIE2_9GLOM|nr:hypothetical protein C1645_784186 [Glomus cerebriforme]RIA86017.1 hypothetical protein C1645_878949 [Glomus cerebriforme]